MLVVAKPVSVQRDQSAQSYPVVADQWMFGVAAAVASMGPSDVDLFQWRLPRWAGLVAVAGVAVVVAKFVDAGSDVAVLAAHASAAAFVFGEQE